MPVADGMRRRSRSDITTPDSEFLAVLQRKLKAIVAHLAGRGQTSFASRVDAPRSGKKKIGINTQTVGTVMPVCLRFDRRCADCNA